MLLSVLQQNPLWNQSETVYYLSCSRIHSGANQKSSIIHLAAESTQEPIRSRLLSILQQNPLWNQSELVYYPSFNLATKYTLGPIRSRLLSILPSCRRIHSRTNRKSPTINLGAASTLEPICSRLQIPLWNQTEVVYYLSFCYILYYLAIGVNTK